LSVRDLDREMGRRLRVPDGTSGVVVSRVDPMSSAGDAGIERGYVLMEINRQPVRTTGAYERIVRAVNPGDVLAFYVYIPDLEQRAFRTVRINGP
jgi:serine protease Do